MTMRTVHLVARLEVEVSNAVDEEAALRAVTDDIDSQVSGQRRETRYMAKGRTECVDYQVVFMDIQKGQTP